MEKKINTLMELLELNERQATDIVSRYLRDIKDIDKFVDYYFETLESENIVGTTYEKLRRVCVIAELELKKRFEDKEGFLKWLGSKYKNRAFFRVFDGDFEYSYYAYDSFGNSYKMSSKAKDMLVALNPFKELSYMDGELIPNGIFKEALVEFIFQNQHRIGKHLYLNLPQIKPEKLLSLEEKIALEKQEEKKLYEANKARFEKLLQSKRSFKNIS